MKTALCLSGGGANAGFHIGALQYLLERGASFSVIAGVSSGALNGAMMAQERHDRLFEIWRNVTEAQVFRRVKVMGNERAGIAYRCFVQKKLSFYDASPLLDFVRNEVCLANIKKQFYAGVVSFNTGNYHSLPAEGFASEAEFQNAIYSSALMPIAMGEPLDVETKFRHYKQCYDGGVKNVSPLGDLLKDEPGRIIVIGTHARRMQPKTCKNIVDVSTRMIEIMLSEIIKNDIRDLLRINDLVAEAAIWGRRHVNKKTGKSYKHYEAIVISPDNSLGDPLDFSRSHIDACIRRGYEKAKEVYLL